MRHHQHVTFHPSHWPCMVFFSTCHILTSMHKRSNDNESMTPQTTRSDKTRKELMKLTFQQLPTLFIFLPAMQHTENRFLGCDTGSDSRPGCQCTRPHCFFGLYVFACMYYRPRPPPPSQLLSVMVVQKPVNGW